jgi:sporulation protein YpjB
LVQHYGIIRPSLFISRSPSEVEKMDSLMAFMQKSVNSNPVPVKQVQSGIGHLRQALDDLFMKKREATAYLPITDPHQPILWTILIASIIISVLTFAGYRMFKGGRDIVPVKHKERG